MLAKIDRKEVSAHSAALEAVIRHLMIRHSHTVEGFARALRKHLDEKQRAELKGQFDRIATNNGRDLTRRHAVHLPFPSLRQD